MQTQFPVQDLHELRPVAVGDARQWFAEHPTVRGLFPKDLETGVMEKIMQFMGWLELYLEDENCNKDETITLLADMQKCSAALAWYWIHSEYVTDSEMLDRIAQGADVFHKKAGFCCVYHPSKCKQDIGTIEKALRISFRDLQLPRQMRELRLSNREVVPPAQVPSTNDELSSDASDDEAIDGNTTENL